MTKSSLPESQGIEVLDLVSLELDSSLGLRLMMGKLFGLLVL
jgi:hypothetical protein